MCYWSTRAGVKPHFIQPGKPIQKELVKIFNGRVCEYCRVLEWFASIEDARIDIGHWQRHYNDVRLHHLLNKETPAVFIRELGLYA